MMFLLKVRGGDRVWTRLDYSAGQEDTKQYPDKSIEAASETLLLEENESIEVEGFGFGMPSL